MEKARSFYKRDYIQSYGPVLNRFYRMTVTAAYAFMPSYLDQLLHERLYLDRHWADVENYVEIKLREYR